MIKIFNKKTDKSILIDETLPQVSFEPNDWHLDNPHLLIKLDGINFSDHARTCEDCKALKNSFGTDTSDWYVEYLGKVRRLDLSTLGKNCKENHLSWTQSYYFSGATLKLNLDTDTIESLTELLTQKESVEDYEGCSKILDKINSIRD